LTDIKTPFINVELLSSIPEEDRLTPDREILRLAKKNGNYLLEPKDLEGSGYDWKTYADLVKDYVKFRSALNHQLDSQNADQLLRLAKFYQDGSKKITQSKLKDSHDPIFDMVGFNVGYSGDGMVLGFTTTNWQNPIDSLIATGYVGSIGYQGNFRNQHALLLDLGFVLGGEIAPSLIMSGAVLVRAGVANRLIPPPDFSDCANQDGFQEAARVIEDYAATEGYRYFRNEFQRILDDQSRVNVPGIGEVEVGPRIDLPPTPPGPDMSDVQEVIQDAANEVATCAANKAQEVINDSYRTVLAVGFEWNIIFSFGERFGIGAKTAILQDVLDEGKLKAWENRDQFPLDYQIGLQLYVFN
jgi:hypothetical protein